MLLYFLRARMLYSYRIITYLQSISLLLYTTSLIDFSYEDELMLRTMSYSLGPYFMAKTHRLDLLQLNHVLPTIVVTGTILLFGLIVFGYFPIKIFNHQKSNKTYLEYLKSNILYFVNGTYFFSSRLMFVFIGMHIKQAVVDIGLIIASSLYGIFIIVVIISTLYQYHYDIID